jgi:hypothetical protein
MSQKPIVTKSSGANPHSGTGVTAEKQIHNNDPRASRPPASVAPELSALAKTDKLASRDQEMPAAKPLTPVGALWPNPVTSKQESKPPQAQIQQIPPPVPVAPLPASAASTSPKPPAPTRMIKPEPSIQAPRPSPAKTVTVRFSLSNPGAKSVSLCGEFNGWSPGATPMAPKAEGCWEATLALRPGRYQYKFVVDGQWLHDPHAQKNVPNPHGSLNSVMEV